METFDHQWFERPETTLGDTDFGPIQKWLGVEKDGHWWILRL